MSTISLRPSTEPHSGMRISSVDHQEQWAAVLSAVAARPVADPDAVLRAAVRLGLTVAPGAAACSVTQLTSSGGYRTTVATDDLAVTLDEVQYATGAGPCLLAASGATIERVDDMATQTRWPELGLAAAGRGVRSSLSLGLTDLDRPAALNLYADSPAAFAAERPLAVAGLLARCVTTVLRGGPAPLETAIARRIRDQRNRVHRAEGGLMSWEQLTRPQAFAVLTQQSRQQRRSLHRVVDDLLREAGQDPA